ncbi:hypothetical protein AFLA_005432 [Aspergillus flavus NRRL3357]|nr:hypothetical protein AFLA_005432 [Aspergillus flavus NRRL3357]
MLAVKTFYMGILSQASIITITFKKMHLKTILVVLAAASTASAACTSTEVRSAHLCLLISKCQWQRLGGEVKEPSKGGMTSTLAKRKKKGFCVCEVEKDDICFCD